MVRSFVDLGSNVGYFTCYAIDRTGRDVVGLGIISDIVIKNGNVGFAIEVTPEEAPRLEPLRKACEQAVRSLPGVLSCTAVLTAERAPGGKAAALALRPVPSFSDMLPVLTELSPAYDVTHAHNPRGQWTYQHLLSVNGKFSGITRSDLLVINKIDLAPMVGASLEVMDRDAKKMRGGDQGRPFVFSNMKTGQGLEAIIAFIVDKGMLPAR